MERNPFFMPWLTGVATGGIAIATLVQLFLKGWFVAFMLGVALLRMIQRSHEELQKGVPKLKPTIHGDIVIRLQEDGSEVHRIPCQYEQGSPEYEKVERGLLRQVDTDTYTIEWEPR